MEPHRDEFEAIRIRKTINQCGIVRLRKKCKEGRMRNVDRNMFIAFHCLQYGPSACITKYGISRQRADQIMRKVAEAAEEAVAEMEAAADEH